jgi:hypothetical protein
MPANLHEITGYKSQPVTQFRMTGLKTQDEFALKIFELSVLCLDCSYELENNIFILDEPVGYCSVVVLYAYSTPTKVAAVVCSGWAVLGRGPQGIVAGQSCLFLLGVSSACRVRCRNECRNECMRYECLWDVYEVLKRAVCMSGMCMRS